METVKTTYEEDPKTLEQLKAIAERQGISIAAVIRWATRAYVKGE